MSRALERDLPRSSPFNPKFWRTTQDKRRAERQRKAIAKAEQAGERIRSQARAEADAILASALAEARAIVAHEVPIAPAPRPVIAIIAEEARAHGVTAKAIVSRTLTRRVNAARSAAIVAAWRERQDLSMADLGRIFGGRSGSAIRQCLIKAGERL